MNFLERQLENPVRFARIKRWFYISLVVIVVAEVLVLLVPIALSNFFPPAAEEAPDDLDTAIINPVEQHHRFWFESIPAWGSLYGLVSCVLIIVISKFLGKVWLMRQEDHYES